MSLLIKLLMPKKPHPVPRPATPPPENTAAKTATGEKYVYWHKEHRCFYISIRNKKLFKSGIKTLEDAVEIRDALLANYEKQHEVPR